MSRHGNDGRVGELVLGQVLDSSRSLGMTQKRVCRGMESPAHSALETLRPGSRHGVSSTGRAEYPALGNGKAILREPV